MIVQKTEIEPDIFEQKIWVPKKRKILDVIKFRGRPHIVYEQQIEMSEDVEFEDAIIIQIPELRFINSRNRYIGHWKTSANINYVYYKPRRK